MRNGVGYRTAGDDGQEMDKHFLPNGKRFIAQSQNTFAKPLGLVVFEYTVLAATIGSLIYLAW